MSYTRLSKEDIISNAQKANSWPFMEAKKILNNIKKSKVQKKEIIFETGYGPSGLPHIGTFTEVARTSMIIYAFNLISDIPTRLIAFSDDMDAFRKIPSNLPNAEMLETQLGRPLTSVKDPFDKMDSLGAYNNNKLQEFLTSFGFKYEFISSTHMYKSGKFNDSLIRVLEKYDEIINVILPTLGEERQQTYSPFLPVNEKTGRVLQAKVIKTDVKNATIVYIGEDGKEYETSILNGKCKLQWKVDWAMRWYHFGVDYEMSGKDLISSVELSTKICKIMGKTPPIGMTYELFLDKNGEKISKSKGNGVSVEQWLRYGNQESLSYFLFNNPTRAKRIYFEEIIKNVDAWISDMNRYDKLSNIKKLQNPMFYIYKNKVPSLQTNISWNLILNLVTIIKSTDTELLWKFVKKYNPNISMEDETHIRAMLQYAVNYFMDIMQPKLSYKNPNKEEKALLQLLLNNLINIPDDIKNDPVELQKIIYKIGRENENIISMSNWFMLIYECVLGHKEGPRMGTFLKLYGVDNFINKLKEIL